MQMHIYQQLFCSLAALLLACYHRNSNLKEDFHVVLIKYLVDGVQNDWFDLRYGQ